MNWLALGIEPTTDVNAIKEAYRARLKTTNPEDKPEEFKALREAYEEALALAEEAASGTPKDKTPVDLWADRLEDLYFSLPRRLDVAEWKALLSQDICLGLDTRPQIEERLLAFLLDNYYNTQAVWQYLDSQFSFSDRRDELCERYPRDFVDFILLEGIQAPENVRLNMFEPGLDGRAADEFIHLYYKILRENPENSAPLFEQMEALPEQHPYGRAVKLRIDMYAAGDDPDAQTALMAQLKDISDAYPNDVHLLLDMCTEYFQHDNFAEAEAIARRILETQPDRTAARLILAKSLAAREKYADAVEQITDLMSSSDGNQKQEWEYNKYRTEWNDRLMEKYKAALEADPEDYQSAFDLAWCDLQNDKIDEAYDLAGLLPEGFPDPFGYNNLKSWIHIVKNELEQALDYTSALIEVIRNMEEDGTDKTRKRIARLPEMYLRKAKILLMSDRKDEAVSLFTQALEVNPDDTENLTEAAMCFASVQDYNRAIAALKHLIELCPRSYHGYFLLARVYFEQRNDRDAFDMINRALDLENSDLAVYLLKLRILLRNNAYDEARSLIEYMEKNGCEDFPDVKCYKAILAMDGDEDMEAAGQLFDEVEACLNAGEAFGSAGDFYFNLAYFRSKEWGTDTPEAREKLIALLDKGLEDGFHYQCADYRAWLLKKDGRREEALEAYLALEARKPHDNDVENALASLFFKQLNKSAPEALHYYEILNERQPENPDWYFYLGMCHHSMEDLEGAERLFLKEIELEPESVDGYFRLANVYLAMGRTQEALPLAEKAVEVIRDEEGDKSYFWGARIQALLRMGKPLEAIEVMKEASDKYSVSYQTEINEAYAQFGMWKEADEFIRRWHKAEGSVGTAAQKASYYHVLNKLRQGKLDAAKRVFFNWLGPVVSDDTDDLRERIARQEFRLKTSLKYQRKRLDKKLKEENANPISEYSEYAFILFLNGDTEEARKAAEEGLELLDKSLAGYSRNKLLFLTKKASMVAILGREDEARALLEEARHRPLCEMCNYCRCKDADLFEARVDMICGHWEDALARIEEGLAAWPDEEDFVALKHLAAKLSKKQKGN